MSAHSKIRDFVNLSLRSRRSRWSCCCCCCCSKTCWLISSSDSSSSSSLNIDCCCCCCWDVSSLSATSLQSLQTCTSSVLVLLLAGLVLNKAAWKKDGLTGRLAERLSDNGRRCACAWEWVSILPTVVLERRNRALQLTKIDFRLMLYVAYAKRDHSRAV